MLTKCPPGFSITRINTDPKHIYYQCNKIKNISGKVVQCSYKMRADRPKSLQHTHAFDLPLNNYFASIPQNTNLDLEYYSLITNLDLSINAAASQHMYQFIKKCIIVGQNNPNAKAETLFSFNSRNTLRTKLCKYATIKKKAILEKYSNFSFNSLMIDAGTNHGVPYLIAVISNPLEPLLKPLIFAAYRNFTGDLMNYKRIVINIIMQLKNSNVKIGSITADNLPVQRAAIDPSSQNSFQFQSSHQDNYPVLYFPCIAHTISLGIKDAFQCENLSNIQNDISNFQNTCDQNEFVLKYKMSVLLSAQQDGLIYLRSAYGQ